MLKIMIVDDDINVSKCLRSLIDWDALNYSIVASASNGAEALELARTTTPDVIITDIKMPIMDGTEFCKKVREIMEDVPIIFLSAYNDFAAAQLALSYNVTEYILKPINMKQINLLTKILKNISDSYINKEYFSRIISDRKLEQQLIDKLMADDVDFFVAFFDEFTKCSAGNVATVQAASAKLIHLLYRYLEIMGIPNSVTEGREAKTQNELTLLNKKMDMVTHISNLYFNVLQLSNHNQEDYYHNIMKKVKKYIDNNYSDPLFSVTSIAEHFNFSADYIGKLFGKYFGLTINTYLSTTRLEKAVDLLKNSNYTVNNICQQVGYSSSNYFARVFKKQFGLSPSEYKEKYSSLYEKLSSNNM